jgi:hypothetical protein
MANAFLTNSCQYRNRTGDEREHTGCRSALPSDARLPDLVGALRGHVPDWKTAFRAIDLRAGMAAIALASGVRHAPPRAFTADGEGLSPPLQWTGVPGASVLRRRG